jgi:hypothetical protein
VLKQKQIPRTLLTPKAPDDFATAAKLLITMTFAAQAPLGYNRQKQNHGLRDQGKREWLCPE